MLAAYQIQKFSRTCAVALCLCTTLYSPLQAKEKEAKKEVQTKVKETSIARDVLQPLGMPVVTTFHNVRENAFLNMKYKDATLLEAVGDFFLSPSRYLFAGKNVKLDPKTGQCSIYQSFHYRKLHWLKTTLALTVLPVSELLGATLKGIAYLSPEVRTRQKVLKNTLRSTEVVPHQEEYLAKGIPTLHCADTIPCQGHKRPSTLTKRQQIEIETLKEISEIFDNNGIVWWIDCGTCLGAYRYGGIIPWDWDIDISILMPDHDNVKRLLSHLDPEKYQIQDWSSYSKPKTFLKLYVKETKNFIDIYHYDFNEQTQQVGFNYTYIDSPFPYSWKKDELRCINPLKYEDLFPLKKANFDGVTVWAPNNVVTFLQSKYGDNLSPSNIWDEDAQCYRKDLNHPYWKD
jgi:phosphorylcholine metabolism protein LicD